MTEKKESLIILDYGKESQKELMTISKDVTVNMPQTPDFEPCNEALEGVKKGYEWAKICTDRASDGSIQHTVARKEAIEALIPLLGKLAAVANPIVGQNANLARLSGLKIRVSPDKKKQAVGDTAIKPNSIVLDMKNNSFTLKYSHAYSARYYEIEYRYCKSDVPIGRVISSTLEAIIKDVDLNNRLYVRVRGVDLKNVPGPWSEEFPC